MNNPEKLATLCTQNIGRRQTTHKAKDGKLKRLATLISSKTGVEPRYFTVITERQNLRTNSQADSVDDRIIFVAMTSI